MPNSAAQPASYCLRTSHQCRMLNIVVLSAGTLLVFTGDLFKLNDSGQQQTPGMSLHRALGTQC